MKKLRYFALGIAALLISSCDDEDGFYNEKYVDAVNLVEIAAEPDYAVGDYIYVTADISRYLAEPGFDTPLDIYLTTNGARGFVFSYILEKETSAGVWQSVNSTEETMIINAGTVQAGPYVLATAAYNAANERYQFNAGIPLATAGNYRLSFGVNSDATNEIELRSRTQGNNLFLNIISDTNQLNNQGYYTFTVN